MHVLSVADGMIQGQRNVGERNPCRKELNLKTGPWAQAEEVCDCHRKVECYLVSFYNFSVLREQIDIDWKDVYFLFISQEDNHVSI